VTRDSSVYGNSFEHGVFKITSAVDGPSRGDALNSPNHLAFDFSVVTGTIERDAHPFAARRGILMTQGNSNVPRIPWSP